MRFDYWTIRVIPRPMGVTSIGVGVVVFDPETGQSATKFRSDTRLYSESEHSEATTKAIRQFEEDLHQISAPSHTLDIDKNYSIPSYLRYLHDHWMNLIRVDRVRSMDEIGIQEATDRLFSVLIGDPPTPQARRSVTHIRSSIRRIYHEFARLSP